MAKANRNNHVNNDGLPLFQNDPARQQRTTTSLERYMVRFLQDRCVDSNNVTIVRDGCCSTPKKLPCSVSADVKRADSCESLVLSPPTSSSSSNNNNNDDIFHNAFHNSTFNSSNNNTATRWSVGCLSSPGTPGLTKIIPERCLSDGSTESTFDVLRARQKRRSMTTLGETTKAFSLLHTEDNCGDS